MSEDLSLRRTVAETLLGCPLPEDGYAPCPGQDLHNGKTGPRDFRVILTEAPTGFCFHASCSAAVEQFNKDLRSRIGKAETGGEFATASPLGDVAAKPTAPRRPRRVPFDPAALARFAAICPHPAISLAWLRDRSPVAVPPPEEQGRETACDFLAALFGGSERVLVFTRQWSQGDFLWDGSHGTFRLGDTPRASMVESPLPDGGLEGIWFLCQPVTAEWCANPYASRTGGSPQIGRRHGGCVTAWRYLVLESDVARPEEWLRALVQLPLPIVAVYSSGGRSVHALARVDARNKAEWDSLRDELSPVLCPLGADPAAMTAVRLTRLPGMMRHGTLHDGRRITWPQPRLQELAWLNPRASARPIIELTR